MGTCAACMQSCRRYLQVHTVLTCFSKESGTDRGGVSYSELVGQVAAAAGVQHRQFVFNRLAVCSTENSSFGRVGVGACKFARATSVCRGFINF